MRKMNVLAAAFAPYGFLVVAGGQAQSAARQNAPPREQEQLAKQISGAGKVYSIKAASVRKCREIRNGYRLVC